jgi:hypothetical protein
MNGLEPIAVEKVDFGPCATRFKEQYLGRTEGDTQFNYSIETFVLETEEDGKVDEIVIDDALIVTIPLLYTDVDTLATIIPWAKLVAGLNEEKKLVVGKAVGKRLSDFAGILNLHPINKGETDLSRDLTVHKCYPKPGPINFAYSRQGKRIANVQFIAMPDPTKPADENYFTLGDPSIQGDTGI